MTGGRRLSDGRDGSQHKTEKLDPSRPCCTYRWSVLTLYWVLCMLTRSEDEGGPQEKGREGKIGERGKEWTREGKTGRGDTYQVQGSEELKNLSTFVKCFRARYRSLTSSRTLIKGASNYLLNVCVVKEVELAYRSSVVVFSPASEFCSTFLDILFLILSAGTINSPHFLWKTPLMEGLSDLSRGSFPI